MINNYSLPTFCEKTFLIEKKKFSVFFNEEIILIFFRLIKKKNI